MPDIFNSERLKTLKLKMSGTVTNSVMVVTLVAPHKEEFSCRISADCIFFRKMHCCGACFLKGTFLLYKHGCEQEATTIRENVLTDASIHLRHCDEVMPNGDR